MPIGIKQGTRVEVVAQMYDANGNLVMPPAGAVTLNIAYTDASFGSTAAFSATMVQNAQSLVAAWNSSAAAIGQAIVSITAPAALTPPDPVLRITQNT